jgi:exosortase family protein XrtF
MNKDSKELRPIIIFLVSSFAFYLCWDFVYFAFIEKSSTSLWLTKHVAQSAVFFLQLFDVNTQMATEKVIILVNNQPCVTIRHYCNASEFFGLFFCMVLTFPAAWKHKLWFVVLGILSIHLLNIFRVAMLALNQYYYPQYLDVNHKYIFVFIVYGLIFVMWVFWIQKFSYYAKKS